jgi:hypothetical protein
MRAAVRESDQRESQCSSLTRTAAGGTGQ